LAVKLPALTGGGSDVRQGCAPGKDFNCFYIAPLDPALTSGACGKRAGQIRRFKT
jgi:hypothetical protein